MAQGPKAVFEISSIRTRKNTASFGAFPVFILLLTAHRYKLHLQNHAEIPGWKFGKFELSRRLRHLDLTYLTFQEHFFKRKASENAILFHEL